LAVEDDMQTNSDRFRDVHRDTERVAAWLGVTIILTVAAMCVTAIAGGGQRTAPPAIHERDVAIPMRDGVVLRADILRPAGDGRFPTLVYRTPYGKHFGLESATTFARAVERGYAVVVQDVRGRYASDGEFRPYQNEGRDGYDTIEWAAGQRWSSGDVGTFGLSYPGAVQWLAAVEDPPHLKAMVPAMTFSTPQNFFYSWGVWDMSWIDWIWFNIAPDVRVKKHLEGPKTSREAREAWKASARAMQETLPLDQIQPLRDVAPYYYEWLHHPPEDRFWDFAELRGKYGRTRAAVLNLSGWYDDNYGPEGATTNFSGLREARRGGPLRAALLIGPWVHGGTEKNESGEREFGSAAAIDYDAVVLDWMDTYVVGKKTSAARPVRYFVMGENKWRDETVWPPPSTPTSYYLNPPTSAGGVGTLSTSATRGAASDSEFVSDPLHPVMNQYSSSGAHDYRSLVERDDVLTFDSEPLTRDTEVTGPIEARVFLSCDCRDTDLWVRLLDVGPDGSSFNLMTPGLDVLRASYRDVKRGRQLLESGKVYELRLDHLLTSNVFQKGHRIRAQISTTFFPNFSRNLHTGDLETVSGTARRARIRIHHDREHPSRLILPIIAPAARPSA
jgi:putative CocE/NonD family hydrolase